ncbi:hypothetical protein [Ancylobacter oerskovii]|uniref:Uncharacterized protein n=1 Tax=Ancylobacter oerskovii TaxID=459519 RepID=A0ABW4Z109_9HYPH|nr:hypothetical protein [Ancylobacter oerskovii]MBS7542532.1 hypothetical protein [Ancylobacter oerskovii]
MMDDRRLSRALGMAAALACTGDNNMRPHLHEMAKAYADLIERFAKTDDATFAAYWIGMWSDMPASAECDSDSLGKSLAQAAAGTCQDAA